jgi:hypothetical protein
MYLFLTNIFFFLNRTRHYNPPDVAGYFDKVVWPHYVQTYNDIRDNPNIGRFILVNLEINNLI